MQRKMKSMMDLAAGKKKTTSNLKPVPVPVQNIPNDHGIFYHHHSHMTLIPLLSPRVLLLDHLAILPHARPIRVVYHTKLALASVLIPDQGMGLSMLHLVSWKIRVHGRVLRLGRVWRKLGRDIWRGGLEAEEHGEDMGGGRVGMCTDYQGKNQGC
jgi:hypothetical protein